MNKRIVFEYISSVIKNTILEGGNTFALDRETGEKKGFAEKIDFTQIDRDVFTNEFFEMFNKLNQIFEKKFGFKMWEDINIIKRGDVLTGSAKFLFDKGIPNEEFVKHKPTVGDIDIAIPHDYLENLFDLLLTLEDKKLTKRIKYIGNNKRVIGQNHQINCIFEFTSDAGISVNAQVDFEGAKFEGSEPTEWAKFSHSSNWSDIKNSIKGVAHKYLLKAIARNVNKRNDIVILTKNSPLEPPEKIVLRKTRGELIEPQGLAFSVDRGIRSRYVQQFINDEPVMVNGKFAFKDADTNESEYLTKPMSMFEIMFKKEPDSSDMEKFGSFIGLVELMSEHLDDSQVKDSFSSMIKGDMWGPGSQELERDSAKLDMKIKMTMVNKLIDKFPYLKSLLDGYEGQIKKYYESYGKRRR